MTPSSLPGPSDARPAEHRVHAAALRALDLTAADRDGVVERMFARRHRDAVGYWLQLLLSMGIATVGLVLDSTAVVIGAMLIAPLMGPIVELGMGLVVGSPVLTLRSFGRMAASVAVTVAGAALLTLLLPFHEITTEVATRTSPTALDLLLAVFVALAAAFTTARPGSETTSAAAGTAIGIALVPPVCVMGFGVGIGDLSVAGGATLLFLTNLTAILVVSVVFFWTLGFETVDERAWEEAALAKAPASAWTRTAVDALRHLFGSRYGRVVRVGIPLLLVAAVFVPLRRGLEQVAWEVRARTAVGRILDRTLEGRRAVQSRVAVARGVVSADVYLVGGSDEAAALERDLAARVAAETGVEPTVRVVAVPDAGALRQATASRDGAETPVPPDLGEVRRRVGAALGGAWPVAELGPLLSWRLAVPDSGVTMLEMEHLGPAAGPAAEALLARAISERSGLALAVRTRALPPGSAAAPLDSGAAWVPVLRSVLTSAAGASRAHVCVTLPVDSLLEARTTRAEVAREARDEAARLPRRASVTSVGDRWSVRISSQPCVSPAAAVGQVPSKGAIER